MKWVVFYQTPYNSVKYLTDEMQEETSLPYQKFCDWIFSHRIRDIEEMRIRLNCFDTIYLYFDTLLWEVIKPERKVADFETLLKLNPTQEEIKAKEDDSKIEAKGKRFLNSVQTWRKENDRFNRYR